MVSDTSALAYQGIKAKLGDKQRVVFKAIQKLGYAHNKQIADHLGWEINRVTGRTNELEEMGRIEVAYKAPGETGRLVKYWHEVNEEEVEDCI